MLVNPTSFINSISEAEMSCYNYLTTVVSGIKGITAFLGIQPITGYNRWTFGFTTPDNDINANYYNQTNLVSLTYQAQSDCVFSERHYCQQWQASIIKNLPICSDSIIETNITHFCVTGITGVTPDEIQLTNESKSLMRVWKASIFFNVRFVTGGRSI